MPDFPNQVNATQAPAVAGDFASANPRKTVLAGEGALISGTGFIAGVSVPGAVVGRWAWLSYSQIDNDNAPAVLNTFGAGIPAGLVSRKQTGLITQYLGTAVQYLLSGFQISAWSDADLWVANAGAAAAQVGQKAFAVFADGTSTFAAAGATPTGGSGSASSVAAATFSVTGTVIGDILTAASGLTGNIYPGASFSGTNITAAKIVSQVLPLLGGEALNGLGRYTVSVPGQNAASTAISGTYGVLTVGGTVVPGFGAGQVITGTGISVTTTVYQQLTGTAGAAGTYVVDVNTVVSSTAITSQSSIETDWYCKSFGAVGELVKISRLK